VRSSLCQVPDSKSQPFKVSASRRITSNEKDKKHLSLKGDKIMKRRFIPFLLFLVALSAHGQSSNNNAPAVSLDDAIRDSSLHIQDNLNQGSTVIVYQFQSQNEGLSDYILKELFNLLVNSHRFVVLDRSAQEVINAELYFQFNESAGMISDDSLASLTKRIGAQAIITGSLDDTGSEYRFRIRAIGTETTAALLSYVVSVNKNDRRVAAFLNRQPGIGQKIGTGTLNLLFGVGSYLERDITGGITISAGYAVAVGLFIIEATALDWDNPAAGVPGTIGFAVAGVTVVYGFARPFIYNRSRHIAAFVDNLQPKIVLASDQGTGNSNFGVQLSYTIRF
jgi:hypothetical protein